MKYVLDKNGNIMIGPNGQPMVKDGDKKFEIDAIGANKKIADIVAESNDRRKRLGEATTALSAFEDIEDPAAAIKALQTVASMDDDRKAEIEKVTNNINQSWETKQKTWDDEKTVLESKLFDSNVGNNFATSKTVGKTVLSPNIAKATFSNNFKNDGTAVDDAGNQILSVATPGQPAKFDEALTILINSHPDKDSIWKSTVEGGGGYAAGASGGNDTIPEPVDDIKAGIKAA